MTLNVIILAAGKSKRINSSKSKLFQKLANYSIYKYVLDLAKNVCPNQILFVTNEESSELRKLASKHCKDVINIIQKQQLGTGDAVKAALPHIKDTSGDTIILYADTPFLTVTTLSKLIREIASPANIAVSIIGFKDDCANTYGRVKVIDDTERNEISKIIEFVDLTEEDKGINLLNSGVMAVKNAYIKEFVESIQNNNNKKEYYLTDLVSIAKSNGMLATFVEGHKNEVVGINTREDLIRAEKIIQDYHRKRIRKNGVTIESDDTVFFSHDTEIGNDSVICAHNYFGPGVKIGEKCEIKSFSHLENCQISNNAIIGPYARIRDNCTIGKNSHIGNFIEIKNTKIGESCKISHYGYIGDAEIGNKTNISAGFITCNFNGVNKEKFKTKIAENCFIGASNIAIAPINIDQNSFTAAMSIIDKDLNKDSFLITERKSKITKNKKK